MMICQKKTNDDVQESNIEVLRSSKTLHIAPYKKDTNSRLDTIVQHDSCCANFNVRASARIYYSIDQW